MARLAQLPHNRHHLSKAKFKYCNQIARIKWREVAFNPNILNGLVALIQLDLLRFKQMRLDYYGNAVKHCVLYI